MYFILNFHFFSVTFLLVARKKSILTQITIHTKLSNFVQIVDKKDNFSFSSMLFGCRNLFL